MARSSMIVVSAVTRPPTIWMREFRTWKRSVRSVVGVIGSSERTAKRQLEYSLLSMKSGMVYPLVVWDVTKRVTDATDVAVQMKPVSTVIFIRRVMTVPVFFFELHFFICHRRKVMEIVMIKLQTRLMPAQAYNTAE